MWEDIVLSIGEAIVGAVSSNWLEKKKREKFKNKVNCIVVESMQKYADSSLDCNEFYLFVKGRNFRELIRNFFCSTKDGLGKQEYMENMEKYLYRECPTINHTEVREFISSIRELYVESLHKIVEDTPEINAAFQLLTLSHRNILSKISESEENVERYFKALSNTNVCIDNNYIKSYHDVCQKEYGVIRFTGISGAESKSVQDIEQFYVKNTFSFYPTKDVENIYRYDFNSIECIQLEEFFDYGNKIVLIGAAGLGKSTTLNYVFCKYEEMYSAYAVKIKLDLKEYAKNVGEEKKDLLWCITTEFRKRIKRAKISFDETEKLLTSYLEEGKCLIILDALDEIPTQSIRNKVRDEIGIFCEIYYLNRFIISTREVGYLRNKFDESFLHIKINEFDDKQIEKYSRNWYDFNSPQSNFKDFWKKFTGEVERARCQGLIRNPIVLILALIIFDIEKNLPTKRVEFYKKCIETFLTVREDRKRAFILSEKTKNILGIDLVVPKIAYYKFSHINENVGYRFSYEELKESVFTAIEVEDRINWSDAVNQYARYLVERTELIRETDEDTLDFAHKTFYEYFLAVFFAKEIENDQLLRLLDEWIGDANYDELARLIIEVIIQNDEPKQHRCIINHMFEKLQVRDNYEKGYKNLDVFIILSDLYNHNMLQPKFHSMYHRAILDRPHYVKDTDRMTHIRKRYSKGRVKYDSKILADMYCNAIQIEGGFETTLNSLFYLNKEYKDCVSQSINEEYMYHIVSLFSIVNELSVHKNKKNRAEKFYEVEKNYFLGEGIEYILKYPQLFLSLIDIMVLTEDYSNLEKLYAYTFIRNRYFLEYTEPFILSELINKARGDANIFLLLLIVLIQCAKDKTNMLIGFLLDAKYIILGDNDKDYQKMHDITIWIWYLLNVDKFADFKNVLMKENLYLDEYDIIYERMYNDYNRYEQRLEDSRIEKFLTEKRTIK